MSRQTPAQRKTFSLASPFWVRLVALCGGLSVTGSSLAISEAPAAEVEGTIHTTAEQLLLPQQAAPSPAPAAVPSYEPAAAPAPVPSFSGLRPSPTATTTAAASPGQQRPAPAPIALMAQEPGTEAAAEPAPIEPAAAPAAPAVPDAPAAPAVELAVPAQISAESEVPAGYNSVFIDPTEYNVGATASPDLVFSERSTGCQITVPSGQSAPAQSCGSAAAPAAPNAQAAATSSNQAGGVQIGPVNVSRRGVSLGNTTIVSREALNERLRPLNILRRGTQQYVFPLSIPAPITSLFGWRVHPIFGDHRFHAGTDLAAPSGTPVLATRSGTVAVSDFLGGYGLTVILRHDGDLESRYAHLSQILVQPGEQVEQGEVIGLVGSTGNSTGPHLHFEMRQLTAQGWVAVDPQEVLEYGVASLLELIDNPMLALSRAAEPKAGEVNVVPVDLPYRPAQPNAS